MRLRAAKNRLKVEHSILDGLRPVLQELLEANPSIQSIIPGVIRRVRDAKGKVRIRITIPTPQRLEGHRPRQRRAPRAVYFNGNVEGRVGGGATGRVGVRASTADSHVSTAVSRLALRR